MNTMNMPGFTADSSLYRKMDHYQMARFHAQADEAIQPAAHAIKSKCYWDCLINCNDDPYYCSVNCDCFCKGGPPRCQYQ